MYAGFIFGNDWKNPAEIEEGVRIDDCAMFVCDTPQIYNNNFCDCAIDSLC